MTAITSASMPRSIARASRLRTVYTILLSMTFLAWFIAVYAGIAVVPIMHASKNVSEHHPSFGVPDARRIHHDNALHQQEFAKAYHIPDQQLRGTGNPVHATDDHHNKENQKYHMVFSTSCSPFQNWQALAFFYFARKAGQPGTITRLVSGCTDDQAKALQKVHQERVMPLQIPGLQTFEMHITPEFDDSDGGSQKYWNKPNGLLHWMEESLGFDGKSDHQDDDAIVIILDPDMMLLRPITADFTSQNYKAGWVDSSNVKDHVEKGTSPVDYSNDRVTHGRPHAQQYGFGSGWLTSLNGRLEEVVGPDSPALKVSLKDAQDFYPAGPPYLATAKDMYQIAVHWVKFLPKVHEIFEPFMCEMHAYSVAAAHLELPHKLATGFMVSDVDSDEEYSFLDNLTKETVCMEPPDLKPTNVATGIIPTDSTTMKDEKYEAQGISIPQLPYVLHFCQRYALGLWFFSKYKLREDMFDECEAPMLKEPPKDVATIYDWNLFPNGIEMSDFRLKTTDDEWKEGMKKKRHLRNGWLLCVVLFGVNEAIEAYKTETCGSPQDHPEFFQKTWHFHDPANFTKSLEDPVGSNPFLREKDN